MKKITDPAGDSITYNYDLAGRLESLTGSSFGGVTQYTSTTPGATVKYRAWDAIKQLTYGNSLKMDAGYDAVLRLNNFKLSNASGVAQMHTEQEFYADSSAFYTKDVLDSRFDRNYDYDQVGRMNYAASGYEARVFANRPRSDNNDAQGPYSISYWHNNFGEQLEESGWYWNQESPFDYNRAFAVPTGRNSAWQYDNAGHLTQDTSANYTYDVAGQNVQMSSLDGSRTVTNTFTGDGKVAKWVETKTVAGNTTTQTKFYVYSSVLGGQLLTEFYGQPEAEGAQQGSKRLTFVYGAGTLIAEQRIGFDGILQIVTWQYSNAITGAQGTAEMGGIFVKRFNPDPKGVQVGFFNPYPAPRPPQSSFTPPGLFGLNVDGGECKLDGLFFPCDMLSRLREATAVAPEEQVRYRQVGIKEVPKRDGGYKYEPLYAAEIFRAFADGYQGYLPIGARYQGHGYWNWLDPNRRTGGFGPEGKKYDGQLQKAVELPQARVIRPHVGQPHYVRNPLEIPSAIFDNEELMQRIKKCFDSIFAQNMANPLMMTFLHDKNPC